MTEPNSSGQAADDSTRSSLNHLVFWPPFLLFIAAIALNFVAPDKIVDGEKVKGKFFETVAGANGWILDYFGWLFSSCAFLALLLCILICVTCFWKSGFGNVRIGGSEAKPLMSMWNWFSITICTTIAIGILFWSTAEPISHLTNPPKSLGAEANSPAAASFSLSTMYLHWSCLLYTSPSPRDATLSRMPSSA